MDLDDNAIETARRNSNLRRLAGAHQGARYQLVAAQAEPHQPLSHGPGAAAANGGEGPFPIHALRAPLFGNAMAQQQQLNQNSTGP